MVEEGVVEMTEYRKSVPWTEPFIGTNPAGAGPVGRWPREGVDPVTEERRPWAASGDEPSPTNEELFRGARVFTTMAEFMTWKDAFETDEEHEAFLADLYESRQG